MSRKKININNSSMQFARFVYLKEKGFIPDGFVIHHIDMNPSNNDIENLQCLSHHEHRLIHAKVNNHSQKLSLIQKQNISKGLRKYYLVHDVWNKGLPSMTEFNKKRILESIHKKDYSLIGKKISASKKGHLVSDATREKIRAKLLGRKRETHL